MHLITLTIQITCIFSKLHVWPLLQQCINTLALCLNLFFVLETDIKFYNDLATDFLHDNYNPNEIFNLK